MNQRNIPRHIAVIMDGNGRWAEKHGRERVFGHINGVESVRRIVKAAIGYGVGYLTLYAFSTENWGRPQEEVHALMELLCKSTLNETPELARQGVRLKFIGDLDSLSQEVRRSVREGEAATEKGDRLTLVIALNYSARWEIVAMTRKLAAEAAAGKLNPEDISAETVSGRLVTAGIPDPDLLIRTSGEQRLSNFLLWQLAYSELYFTDVYWPDFDENELEKAIAAYAKRERRYGLLTK